jgi:hypothetical protein
MAEMMAELQQLRNRVNTLQGQVNAQPAAPTPAANAGRDPGEALKPPKPAPFLGQAHDVVPFLTRMKGYFRMFPNRLGSAESKILFTAPLIQGTATDWFEPILRDYLENENEAVRDQETQNIFADWDNFEVALKDNFGVVNEERQAAAEIMTLRQDKSCAAHSARFRQLASKTEWDDDALMEIYYRSLKEEVKDELYKADRPDTISEYITMAIKIDERQYERRREKAVKARKERGSDFNPYYPNNNRYNSNSNNQRNSRQGNQRGNQSNNTSYGTNSGPMVIGAVKRDKSKITCWNCGKKGHYEPECKNPVKTNQQYKTVPEGRKNRATKQGEETEPQMAIRTTHRIAMTRSGYDNPATDHQIQHAEVRDHCISEQEALEKGYLVPTLTPEEKKQRAKEAGQRFRARNPVATWKPVPEGSKKKHNGSTIAMVRKGKELAPNPDKEPSTEEITEGVHKMLDSAFEKLGTPIERDAQGNVTTVRTNQKTGPYSTVDEIPVRTQRKRPNRHYKDPNYKFTPPSSKGEGSVSTKEIREELVQLMQNPEHPEIYIRSCTLAEERQGSHPVPVFKHEFDPRINPEHDLHHEVSWASCVFANCTLHRQWKEKNNCFPICIPANSYAKPYGDYEIYGYRNASPPPMYGVTKLTYCQELYDVTVAVTRNAFKVIPWNRKAQRAAQQLPQKELEELRKNDPSPEVHDYLNCKNDACSYNHAIYIQTELLRNLKRAEEEARREALANRQKYEGQLLVNYDALNTQDEETEDQQFDRDMGELMDELEEMTKNNERHL